jgi:superfamily II DNA/RNA helicase
MRRRVRLVWIIDGCAFNSETLCLTFSTARPDPPLSETILKALQDSRKITSLYSHQAAAIDAIARGKNVIVSTSTASGKSVIYQVHISFYLPFISNKWNRRFLGTSAEVP